MLRPYNRAEVAFDLVRELGEQGRNSRTYVAWDHQLHAQVVIKECRKTAMASPNDFFNESRALYASAHPNVVQVMYACQDNDNIYVCMPLYANGSVKRLMGTRFLTVREIVSLSCQALS